MPPWKKLTLTLLAATALSGCGTSSLAGRHEMALSIAAPAALSERIIQAETFNLTTWERIKTPNAPINIYIEGDGLAWLNKYTKSLNPTPPDPLALHLAALDPADNVIYMARPCQYSGWNGAGACPDLYWSKGRTAPEVISAYQQALNGYKAAYQTTGFNLIGYSGGAAVAVLVASRRSDVLTLRTIAGNTDYTTFATIHHLSPMDASLNPIDVAVKIAHIPQQHFIGAEDSVVPAALFNSWQQAAGKTACVHSTRVPGATHEKGWAAHWPDLLKLPFSCQTP